MATKDSRCLADLRAKEREHSMKLQVALDTLDIQGSIKLMDEIADYVGVIEVGTPFVIREGMTPVRILKDRYPQIEVLADCKIMDAGELEASDVFAAGADIVTVLGVSDDSTIKGVVRAANTYGRKVMVDMISVLDLANRATEIDKLGVDYICVHTAFDIQSTGANPLAQLHELNGVIKNAQSAVAGGVKLETINTIVEEGAEIIVVGGAISNAPNPAAMAKELASRLR